MDLNKRHNKGEWSELYALAKLLNDNALYGADKNLEKDETSLYPISQIITSALSENKTIYELDSSTDDISIFNPSTGSKITIRRGAIKSRIKQFLNEIKKGSGVFGIEMAPALLRLLNRSTVKATSATKADLLLKSYDIRTMRELEAGYSIKSEIGGLPTLFNASQSTNIVFEIYLPLGFKNKEVFIASINQLDSCRSRVKKIFHEGGVFKVIGAENKVFAENLRTIDSNFHLILGNMLVYYYNENIAFMSALVDRLNEDANIFEEFTPNKYFYLVNIKKFLLSTAMGMVASISWDGTATASGGIIVVKENGELIAYNPSNMDDFQDYLLLNTKLDTPSSRNKFGILYEENGGLYFKLNFQVRFNN